MTADNEVISTAYHIQKRGLCVLNSSISWVPNRGNDSTPLTPVTSSLSPHLHSETSMAQDNKLTTQQLNVSDVLPQMFFLTIQHDFLPAFRTDLQTEMLLGCDQMPPCRQKLLQKSHSYNLTSCLCIAISFSGHPPKNYNTF